MQVQAVPGAITTHDSEVLAGGTTSTADFDGTVNTNNELPSPELLKKIEDYVVLDEDNKSRPFKSVCTGSNVARRVLVIFVRHFYCGVGSGILSRGILLILHRTARSTCELSPRM